MTKKDRETDIVFGVETPPKNISLNSMGVANPIPKAAAPEASKSVPPPKEEKK